MYVIGTAGHVDHGKTTLIQAITGQDPDRLKEEKQRGLTIDLGFAWFELAGDMVGVVDVPGHRDFIQNMVAGVGGLDAALLVVAADEGMMPQTLEHLAIIDLLGVEHGVVALTKCDRVDDTEWLTLITEDINAHLQGTSLEGAPVVRVSGRTGDGVPDLLAALQAALPPSSAVAGTDRPHLPVDRVFSVRGFGTVVTGTLTGGVLRVGDDVVIQPGDLTGRVRGLQSYEQAVSVAQPGSRVAVNLAGVERSQVRRGMVLSYSQTLVTTTLIDTHYMHLATADRPLVHNDEVRLFIGTMAVLGQARILGADAIHQGKAGWLQVRLRDPIALLPGSRFLLRAPSPPETIGGGVVLDAQPGRKHRRYDDAVLQRLAVLHGGSLTEQVALVAARRPVAVAGLQRVLGPDTAELTQAVEHGLASGVLHRLPDETLIADDALTAFRQQLHGLLAAYHADHPLRPAMPIAEASQRLNITREFLVWLADVIEEIVLATDSLRLESHAVKLTPQQQKYIDDIRARLGQQPFTPPSVAELAPTEKERALLNVLVERGDAVRLSEDMLVSRGAYDQAVQTVHTMFGTGAPVTVASVRDRLGSSRKVVLALLEYLDAAGVTRRVGDQRLPPA